MRLYEIDNARVQYITCQCGRVLHVDQKTQQARCEECAQIHTVQVTTTKQEGR